MDFAQAHALKDDLLRKAFERYKRTTDTVLRSAFETFAQQSTDWLEDYALFRALKDAHGGIAWNEWEPACSARARSAGKAREQLRDEVEAQMFYQFLFFRQWFALKTYCNERGIQIGRRLADFRGPRFGRRLDQSRGV